MRISTFKSILNCRCCHCFLWCPHNVVLTSSMTASAVLRRGCVIAHRFVDSTAALCWWKHLVEVSSLCPGAGVHLLRDASQGPKSVVFISTGCLWWWRCEWRWSHRGVSRGVQSGSHSAAGAAAPGTRCWKRLCRSKDWCRSSDWPATSGW